MLGPIDYTPQLDQIVKALTRPSIPTWSIAILSAFWDSLRRCSPNSFSIGIRIIERTAK